MAKLVLLSAGMTGRAHELKVDKTTIGRVDDNTFQIPEPSVSSHHCEVMQRGVKLDELEQGTRSGFDTAGKGFSKKDDKANKIIWISAGVLGLIIVALIIYAMSSIGK